MKEFVNITESTSHYRHIENLSVNEILYCINNEDKKISTAVELAIPLIEKLINAIVDKMMQGGRLFYIGAGTSGRLGILDASECPPTYGVPHGLIVGLIAGGEEAITKAIENAEDTVKEGWKDLQKYSVNEKDIVVGIAASGTTPYVVEALKECKKNGISTGSISCNPNSLLSNISNFPIEVIVGPEFVTGSTRMKSGTAQKMVLNMISTSVMIKLGKVEDNQMVNMQPSNSKLKERCIKMIINKVKGIEYEKAKTLLTKFGSVKKAVEACKQELL